MNLIILFCFVYPQKSKNLSTQINWPTNGKGLITLQNKLIIVLKICAYKKEHFQQFSSQNVQFPCNRLAATKLEIKRQIATKFFCATFSLQFPLIR